MTTSAKTAFGTHLHRGVQVIEELTSVGCPDSTVKEIDVTSHTSSAVRDYITNGLVDSGTLTVTGNWYAGTGQALLRGDLGATTAVSYNIVLANSGGTLTFDAFVTAFQIGAELDGQLTFTATLRIAGAISWS